MFSECKNDGWYIRLQQYSMDLDSADQAERESASSMGEKILQNCQLAYYYWVRIDINRIFKNSYVHEGEYSKLSLALLSFKRLLKKRFEPEFIRIEHDSFVENLEEFFKKYNRYSCPKMTLKFREYLNEVCPRKDTDPELETIIRYSELYEYIKNDGKIKFR